jgi:predicted nucleic acid-binding protein
MIVIADATPLRYLILLEAIDTLPTLYERVLIPQIVANELQRPSTPLPCGNGWQQRQPAYIRVPHLPERSLFRLGAGA